MNVIALCGKSFWVCVNCFLPHANELDFEGRLNKRNQSTLFPYFVESDGVNRSTCPELFCSGVYFLDSVH